MTHAAVTVREARDQHNPPLTQVQLAAAVQVDQTYISLIERGLRVPSDDLKLRLAEALGIAPSGLRFSEPQPETTLDQRSDSPGHASVQEKAS
jgi:transcriptional regulator with XRE-family HTH domain